MKKIKENWLIPSFLCARAFFPKINICMFCRSFFIPRWWYGVCMCCDKGKLQIETLHIEHEIGIKWTSSVPCHTAHRNTYNTPNEGNGFSSFFLFVHFSTLGRMYFIYKYMYIYANTFKLMEFSFFLCVYSPVYFLMRIVYIKVLMRAKTLARLYKSPSYFYIGVVVIVLYSWYCIVWVDILFIEQSPRRAAGRFV